MSRPRQESYCTTDFSGYGVDLTNSTERLSCAHKVSQIALPTSFLDSLRVAYNPGVRSPGSTSLAGTFDQDVHESPGAFLPVGAGGYVGDANQRSKQVEWLEVFAYVAAFDGSPHKCIDRSPNLNAGRIVQPRRTAADAIQCRCDDLLCGNVVDEKHHPGPQRLDRRQACG